MPVDKPNNPAILERCVFRHLSGAWLVADAYQGEKIQQALSDYFAAIAGRSNETARVKTAEVDAVIKVAGDADLVAYIGHNGLMDFDLPEIPPENFNHLHATP